MNLKRYQYSDSSGNTYKISSGRIEYIPMAPELSSSGTYSGGEPVIKPISKSDYNKVQSEIINIVLAISGQNSDRSKSSGAITIMEDQKKDLEIIIDKSPEKDRLEKLLKALIDTKN
ncbi:MAG: hypothetical protein ACJ75J_14590 [Cytophagaceae bacterium]